VFEETINALLGVNPEKVHDAAECLIDALSQKNTVWIIGNGGSASAADHLETDMSFVRSDVPTFLRIVSLSSNSSLLTAISNDVGVSDLFSIQIRKKALPGDCCVVISSSGASPNIIEAIKVCKSKDIRTIGIFGAWGGVANQLVDELIEIPSIKNDFHAVENAQLAVCHALSAIIKSRLKID